MPPPALSTALKDLPGIGTERARQLQRLGLETVQDLIFHRPRRYEDRRQAIPIAELEIGQPATVHGKVVTMGLKQFRRSRKSVFELILDDGTARLHCRWWNLPFMQNYFSQGDEVFAYGKPIKDRPRTMDHPETEVIEEDGDPGIHLNRITPIYPLTEGLPQRWLRALAWRLIPEIAPHLPEPHPDWDIEFGDLPLRSEAFHMIHFPESMEDMERGRQRLALDEFIEWQLALSKRKANFRRKAKGLPCEGTNEWIKPFLAALGFRLTAAQTQVLKDIRKDLVGSVPMRRLVQGDVGSGKTVVAACSALMVMESGHNTVLMAPTEILAEQHYRTFQRWFHPLGLRVELHTGSRKTLRSDPDQALLGWDKETEPPSLVIGTHALVEQGFSMPNIGLVMIDEQHKFGVAQREALVRKGNYPHLLVMTATPIPRTLGLTLYGDLDMSIIDEVPGGRGDLSTYLRPAESMDKVLAYVRQEMEKGRQAYIVYPRVEEATPSAKGTLKAVTREYERIRKKMAPFSVGLLHGRLPSEEKDQIMTAFRTGQLHALVATSVIEVGLDVPNATLMVIENADQFGLAQLHQLRGRIGRGQHDSRCILVADLKTPEARSRLAILERTHDGFEIAEADLEMRGPGEMLGQQQSGLPPFRFANLIRDVALIEKAREVVGDGRSGGRAVRGTSSQD